ncbi:MAG: DNA repair protein RecO [Bacteroidales bacterium OttesenSCG-928-I14]|jgi:DNA repair protein RecO (recombination protein O)|nr:DNA repair protein RecO [Bacteroidales bacterium OttesenSCG-928-I14]
MLHKTKAIILHNVDCNYNYSISYIFTEKFGIIPYLTDKIKNGKNEKSLFQPLSILKLEVEHRDLRKIQYIREAKIYIPLVSILNNPIKSTICIFLAGFISNVIKNRQSDKHLFNYIVQSIQFLELIDQNYANFHLAFMIRLSLFLGFYPDKTNYIEGMYFDMQNGVFVLQKPLHSHFLLSNESSIFVKLLRMNYKNMFKFRFNRHERMKITNKILEYYSLHLNSSLKTKAIEILHEILN